MADDREDSGTQAHRPRAVLRRYGRYVSLGLLLFLAAVLGDLASDLRETPLACWIDPRGSDCKWVQYPSGRLVLFLAGFVLWIWMAERAHRSFVGLDFEADAEPVRGRTSTDVLIFAISRPWTEGAPNQPKIESLELFIEGLERSLDGDPSVHVGRLGDVVLDCATLDQLCLREYVATNSSGGDLFDAKIFAWQQPLRTLSEYLETEPRSRLRRVYVLPSKDTQAMVGLFVRLMRVAIRCGWRGEAGDMPAVRRCNPCRFDAIEELVKELKGTAIEVSRELGLGPEGRVTFDMTSGTRAYAAAAAIASVAKQFDVCYFDPICNRVLRYDIRAYRSEPV